MTTEQTEQAIELHEQGVCWRIIAALKKMTLYKLRKQIKNYAKIT